MSPFTARILPDGLTTWCPAHATADTTVASSTPRHSATTRSVAARSLREAAAGRQIRLAPAALPASPDAGRARPRHQARGSASGLQAARCFGVHCCAAAGNATFPYPIYAKWADAYKKETGVGLNYQSIGSGGGIKQIKAKTVTFGATDAPLPGKE